MIVASYSDLLGEMEHRILNVTSSAGKFLTQKLEEHPGTPVVRLVFGLRGLEPQPSVVLPDDTVFYYQGQAILVQDKTVAQMLAEKTLGIERVGPNTRLQLR